MANHWIPVCKEEDLLDNMGVCAKVDEQQIAIFKVTSPEGRSRIYAIDNQCPFSKANVLARGLVGDIQQRIVVASPIYKQHFDLVTGQCLEDDIQLKTFKVRNFNGVIEVAS